MSFLALKKNFPESEIIVSKLNTVENKNYNFNATTTYSHLGIKHIMQKKKEKKKNSLQDSNKRIRSLQVS